MNAPPIAEILGTDSGRSKLAYALGIEIKNVIVSRDRIFFILIFSGNGII